MGEELCKLLQSHHIDEIPKWESLTLRDHLAWSALAEELADECLGDLLMPDGDI